MKNCFTEQVNEALASDVYGFFAFAPMLLAVNADKYEVTTKLKISGLRVFHGQLGNIGKNMTLFNAGELPEFMPRHNCGAHGRDHECSH